MTHFILPAWVPCRYLGKLISTRVDNLIGTSPASNLSRYITSKRASDIVNDHTNTNAKLAV